MQVGSVGLAGWLRSQSTMATHSLAHLAPGLVGHPIWRREISRRTTILCQSSRPMWLPSAFAVDFPHPRKLRF